MTHTDGGIGRRVRHGAKPGNPSPSLGRGGPACGQLRSWNFEAGLIVNAYGNADNDFHNTAKIVGIDLFDSQGRPITDFTLSSASGASYVGAVPEPSAAALMLVGLLAGLGWRARRSRSADGPSARLAAEPDGASA